MRMTPDGFSRIVSTIKGTLVNGPIAAGQATVRLFQRVVGGKPAGPEMEMHEAALPGNIDFPPSSGGQDDEGQTNL